MSETLAESSLQTNATTEIGEQYSIWQILGIWAGSALPMGLSYWVIMPILLSRGSVNPFMYLFLITLGLVWQGVLARSPSERKLALPSGIAFGRYFSISTVISLPSSKIGSPTRSCTATRWTLPSW